MDLNHLSVFVAVAEARGFSAAAARLRIPKSSVSRAVASLENDMNVRLLQRSTRSVALSTAGAALYERVAPLVLALNQSVQNLPEHEEQPSGTLRLTAPVDFGSSVLAEVVTRFTARYPTVRVDLTLTSQYVDLVTGGFDLAVRISSRRLRDSQLVAKNVGSLTLAVFAAPAYVASRGAPRSPRDLSEHDWVTFRGQSSVKLERAGEVSSSDVHGRINCDDMSFVRGAVRAGAGLGILPTFLTDEDVSRGELQRVLPRWNAPSGDVWVLYPSAHLVPRKVCAFRDFLADSLQKQPAAAAN